MMIHIEIFKKYLSHQLLSMAQQYLHEDHAISISEKDAGCYDAVIQEDGTEY